jgi:hypothetical protein
MTKVSVDVKYFEMLHTSLHFKSISLTLNDHQMVPIKLKYLIYDLNDIFK